MKVEFSEKMKGMVNKFVADWCIGLMGGMEDETEKMGADLTRIIEEAVREVKDDNQILRQLLWLNHGHDGLYGDDGEMQCGKCMTEAGFYDFKRTPAKEIKERFEAHNLRTLAKELKHINQRGVDDEGEDA